MRILRDAGVTRYATPDLTLEFDAAGRTEEAVRRALADAGVGVDDGLGEAETEEPSDPRYLLERMADANRPKPRAD